MSRTAPRFGLYLADMDPERTDSPGIIRYALGLAVNLPPFLRAGEHLVLYLSTALERELPRFEAGQVTVRTFDPPRSSTSRLRMDNLALRRWARQDRLDLLHLPKGLAPLLPVGRCRVVATIHDDIPLLYASHRWGRISSGLKQRYVNAALRRAIRSSDGVITVSHFSRSRLALWAESQEEFHQRSRVTYQGVTVGPRRPSRRETGPYAIILGSRFPHKRTAATVALALRYLERRHPEAELVVVGQLGDEVPSSERLRFVPGPVDRAEIEALIANATWLVFGSEYEGFGLPPVESFLLGTPAVFADEAAVTEIMEGVPGSFRYGDENSFEGAMDHAWEMDKESIQAAGDLLGSRFRWEDAAALTADFYRSIVAEGAA